MKAFQRKHMELALIADNMHKPSIRAIDDSI